MIFIINIRYEINYEDYSECCFKKVNVSLTNFGKLIPVNISVCKVKLISHDLVYTSELAYYTSKCTSVSQIRHMYNLCISRISAIACKIQFEFVMLNTSSYNLFTFSWPQFESGSLRNRGMLILRG